MSLIITISILIRLVAMAWSIVLLRQIKDWRMGFLSIMLGLMALRQILAFWNTRESWSFVVTGQVSEFPGLIVSLMALISVYFLKHILSEHKLTNENLTKLTEQLLENQRVLLELAREDFLNLETSYKRIVKTDAEQLNISRVSIWLFNPDHTEINCQCLYQEGEMIDQAEMTLSASQFPHYFEALEQSCTISANDAHNDPRTSEFSKDYLEPLGITSMMDVPIRLQGETIGIVCHEHIGPMRAWSVQDEDFATSISDMCAMSIQVAERKRTEETLQESNERFSASFADANIGMALVSLDHSIIETNQAFCEMLGYSKDQLTGRFFNDITHADDIDTSFDHHHKLITGEIDNYHFEKRYLHKQGHEIWALLNVSLVRDKDTTPIYTIAQIQDITERKHAENKLRTSEVKYRAIFETSNVGMAMCKLDGTLIECNQTYLDIIGYTEEEAMKLTYWDVTPREFEEYEAEQLQSLTETGRYGPYEKEYIGKDGSRIPVLLSGTLVEEIDGSEYIWSIVQDIGERKQAEKALQGSEERFRALHDNNPHMLFGVDKYGKVLSVNQFGIEQLGYLEEQLVGKSIINVFYEEDRVLAEEYLQKCFAEPNKVHNWELRKVRQDGSILWVRETARILCDMEEATKVLIVCEDITVTRRLSEQLSYQANHDTLTGLVNRREFERRAVRLLSTVRQDNDEHALCFMDLDQFKVVNDTCGHTAGDEMLRQLSSLLQDTVRHRDTLARLGGDEFGVLMEHCSLDDARRVASSLQKVVQDYQFSWEGRSFNVGVSIGLVPITETTINLTQLLKDADAACYMAKDKGRNRIQEYHAEDSEIAERHGEMQWVGRVNQALEEDKFCLYAQPIVPLDGSVDDHYELLIRMIDEKGKTVPPGAFLPAAERYSLMSKIDHWVIKNAFGLLAENPEFLKKINFCSINLSGQSLVDNAFLDFIVAQLNASGINGEKICFEITETAATSNLSTAIKFIATLKGLGCLFALDDFGSGLSSFGYLKNLPVDYLKIDGMFVKDIVDDPIDHAMVKSINEIGQVMGMQTIAEFVENDVIKGMLKEIGVNYGQGFGIGEPQPLDELLSNLNSVNDLKICSA